jgi:hypothetical protein
MPTFVPLVRGATRALAAAQRDLHPETDVGGHAIRQSSTADKVKAVQAFRDAGVPAMYFRRAGHREGDVPGVLNPDEHNFVWFDDPLLNIQRRIDKREGGTVPHA